jgi:hypothetical protein
MLCGKRGLSGFPPVELKSELTLSKKGLSLAESPKGPDFPDGGSKGFERFVEAKEDNEAGIMTPLAPTGPADGCNIELGPLIECEWLAVGAAEGNVVTST